MKCPIPHPSASESAPLDVPVGTVEPENSSQTVPTRRITFKRPPNPLDCADRPENVPEVTMITIPQFSCLSASFGKVV